MSQPEDPSLSSAQDVQTLLLERSFPHPLPRVFAACAEPGEARRWWGAPAGWRRVGAEGELAPGARFRMQVRGPAGERGVLVGTLREITPPVSLAIALRWSGGPLDGRATVVVLTFRAEEGGTALALRQGPFDDEPTRAAHRAFWEAGLDRLARLLAGEPTPCFEDLLDESRAFRDPLGVAAYAVLAGLRGAGAPGETIDAVERALYAHLPDLPPDAHGMLADVLRARLGM